MVYMVYYLRTTLEFQLSAIDLKQKEKKAHDKKQKRAVISTILSAQKGSKVKKSKILQKVKLKKAKDAAKAKAKAKADKKTGDIKEGLSESVLTVPCQLTEKFQKRMLRWATEVKEKVAKEQASSM